MTVKSADLIEVPSFVPNVVDLENYLSSSDTEEINLTIQSIRSKADIWGAVFIIGSLNGEAIEDLAERTFRQWELGEKGKDNGLLLIISMEDRQSRFEVGYGLEGGLPDIVVARALDN